jgi:EF-P beta-lysylation protein EpmB
MPGYVLDPVGDLDARKTAGVLHKYRGRALLVLTGSCAVHCRYCFRRHYPYSDESVTPAQLDAAIEYLATQDELSEVLLSGGDPLSLDTPKLQAITERLARLPKLKRLRIHTRLPVVLPARVDAELLRWLGELPWPVSMVIHANHANELDAAVQTTLSALKPVTQVLLNQAVLLRGINDRVATQRDLSERLYDCGVLPYYLNMLDPVQGAAHFNVDEPTALALMTELRCVLPGYLVPRLVREVPGAPYKTPVGLSA